MDAVEDLIETLTQKMSQVRVLFHPLFKGLSKKVWSVPFLMPSKNPEKKHWRYVTAIRGQLVGAGDQSLLDIHFLIAFCGPWEKMVRFVV